MNTTQNQSSAANTEIPTQHDAGGQGSPTGFSYQSAPGYRPTSGPSQTLRRARDGRMIAGVCRGFADYAGFDPVLVRLVLVLAIVLGFGGGIVLYLAAWILIPEEGTPTAWLDRYVSKPPTA